jgi:nitrogen fixation NifU-like protein
MTDASNNLREVYRHRVLEHSRDPHHFCAAENADREALGFNPLCGDKLTVHLNIEAERVTDIGFEGSGCAISVASASMMTDAVLGQLLEETKKMINEVHAMFSDGTPLQNIRLNELSALEGVRLYPSRVKCATLAWTTLDAALNQSSAQVSTE